VFRARPGARTAEEDFMGFRAVYLAGAFLGLVGVRPLLGQEPSVPAPAAPSTLTVTGTVVSSTPSELVVDVEGGEKQRYVVDAKTSMPPALAAGTRVTVEYRRMDAMMQATRVTVADAAPDATVRSVARPLAASPLSLVGMAGLLSKGAAAACSCVGASS
jgi:hypothetical protein